MSRSTTWRSLAVAVGLLMLLGACSGDSETGTEETTTTSTQAGTAGETTTTTTTAAVEPQTIEFWHAFNAESAEVQVLEEQLIPQFEADHPGITVNAVSVPYNDLRQKLVTAVVGDQLPDVVRSDIIWVPEFANLGVLEPLDTLMPDFDQYAAAVYPGPLETNHWQGAYYGLPLSTNTRVYLSNADVYAAAGVTVPTTQDELQTIAPAIVATGAAAFADNDLSGWNVLPWIWSAGGDIVDADITTASGYINSPESIAGVSLLYDLYTTGAIPQMIVQGGMDPYEEGVATGQYAAMLNGPWAYPILAGDYPDFQLAPSLVPAGDGGSVSVVGGEDIVVTSSSEHKEAAADFVRFMLSPDAQQALAEVGQMSVLQELGDAMVAIQPYYGTFVEQLATARPRPPTPAWTEIDQALKTRLQEAFVGDGDIEQAMNDLAQEIDQILANS
jgi:multiple sugar transport system substrate-binding protein